MNKLLIATILSATFLFSNTALADKWVNGYTKSNGTQVQGHYKSSPDQYRYNNRSSETNGGNKRDEYSTGNGATNKSNSSYNYRDNDNDGYINPYDSKPESAKCSGYYCN